MKVIAKNQPGRAKHSGRYHFRESTIKKSRKTEYNAMVLSRMMKYWYPYTSPFRNFLVDFTEEMSGLGLTKDNFHRMARECWNETPLEDREFYEKAAQQVIANLLVRNARRCIEHKYSPRKGMKRKGRVNYLDSARNRSDGVRPISWSNSDSSGSQSYDSRSSKSSGSTFGRLSSIKSKSESDDRSQTSDSNNCSSLFGGISSIKSDSISDSLRSGTISDCQSIRSCSRTPEASTHATYDSCYESD